MGSSINMANKAITDLENLHSTNFGFDPEEFLVGDLRLDLLGGSFSDGEILIFTDESGIRLRATVHNGNTYNWRAFDSAGTELETIVVRRRDHTQRKYERMCVYVCAAITVNGKVVSKCWKECPK